MRSEELLVGFPSVVSMPNRSCITLDLFGCPRFALPPPAVEVPLGTATEVFESCCGRCCGVLPVAGEPAEVKGALLTASPSPPPPLLLSLFPYCWLKAISAIQQSNHIFFYIYFGLPKPHFCVIIHQCLL